MDNNTVYLVVQRQETKLERGLNKVSVALGITTLVLTVAPVVVCLVSDGIAKIKHNHRIRKGLKDGSIIEVDGKYYEKEAKETD